MEGVVGPVGHILLPLHITPFVAVMTVFLGFMGGLLSGFFGSGGAFIMTPGLMSLGIPGLAAVSGNISHKFGKALVGAKRHMEMGHIDLRFGAVCVVFLLAGVKAAVYMNEKIFALHGKAGSNLYISFMFIVVLSAIAVTMLRDVLLIRAGKRGETEKTKIAEKILNIRIPPVVEFKTFKIKTSIWVPAIVFFGTGYMAGTIGVGGFIGVPGMIYLLGLAPSMAAGTELFLAIFSGALGSFSYAVAGFVDVRIPLLFYLGSMFGVQAGAIATKYLREMMIKVVLVIVILASLLSRIMSVPKYMLQLGHPVLGPQITYLLDKMNGVVLFGGAIFGVLLILINLRKEVKARKAYREVREVTATTTR